jgi:Peptidase S24-like.
MEYSDDVFFAQIHAMVSEGRSVSIRIKGNSMMPFIRSGKDFVVLSPLEREPQVGDILLAVCKGKHILHRVISVREKTVILMGDGNLRETEVCFKSDIVAIVTKILRNGKRERVPGKGRLWRTAGPLRRIVLGIYRRLCPSDFL